MVVVSATSSTSKIEAGWIGDVQPYEFSIEIFGVFSMLFRFRVYSLPTTLPQHLIRGKRDGDSETGALYFCRKSYHLSH